MQSIWDNLSKQCLWLQQSVSLYVNSCLRFWTGSVWMEYYTREPSFAVLNASFCLSVALLFSLWSHVQSLILFLLHSLTYKHTCLLKCQIMDGNKGITSSWSGGFSIDPRAHEYEKARQGDQIGRPAVLNVSGYFSSAFHSEQLLSIKSILYL